MTKNNKKGFTIIEVVLVLAIAGLIFLMVFLALPALQRSQRDTQRRTNLSRMQAALTQYKTAHRGKLPKDQTELTSFLNSYLIGNGDEFIDPSGMRDHQTTIAVNTAGKPVDAYVLTHKQENGSLGNDFKALQNEIFYTVGSKCNEGGETLTGGQGNRVYSIRIKLENAGWHCL
ncbi:MAG: type II secretion system protein, partial [Candidatus Saccharibacteria bacterium]|nr:type II secretion system protein [Candidatus Saccharibacteria bacterium]